MPKPGTRETIMRTLSAVAIAALAASAVHAQEPVSAKKKVCTITINSDHEKKVMEKNLPAAQFEFIELLPAAKKTAGHGGETNGIPDWLNEACEKKIECDVMVISGHFGGTFFGSSGFNLSLEEIERAACRPDCAGLFKKPKETFLFGCNTLAGKKPDHRTPEQYLRVLLEDGIERSEAEQAVALRYSPWGNENLQRMQGVFSGSSKIYGFDSVGPSGKNVEGMLTRYFKAKGPGYAAHLDQLTKQSVPNSALKGALATTTYLEATGLETKSSPAICYLNDKKVPRVSKIGFIERSLVSANPLLYAPAIANWVSELKEDNFIEEEWEMLDRITWSKDTKERFIAMASKIKSLPVIQAAIWEFTMHMRWITDKEFAAKLREAVLPFFSDKKITRSERDAVCNIANIHKNFRVKLTRSELGIRQLTPDMVTALACLGNTDGELVAHAEKSLKSANKDVRQNAAYTFFIMAEISKYTQFSHRALTQAAEAEKDEELKLLLQITAGRAEGGLDLERWWADRVELARTADLGDDKIVRALMVDLYFRKMKKEMIDALLGRLEAVKEAKAEDRTLHLVAYVHALFKHSAEPEVLARAVLERQASTDLWRNMAYYNNDPNPEEIEDKNRGKSFWKLIEREAASENWKMIAAHNLERLNGLHRNN